MPSLNTLILSCAGRKTADVGQDSPWAGLSLRQRQPVSVAQAIWNGGIDSLLGDDERGPAVVGAVALTASPDQASRRTINQAPIPSATTT